MKTIVVIFALAMMVIKNNCNRNKQTNCFKGRLEIKGICSNYTIKLLEGKLDSSIIATNWTDENTGKTYTNVFALGSPCTFPGNIQQGDEFYFTLDSAAQECNVCMAYYPTPPKKLSIKILPGKCR